MPVLSRAPISIADVVAVSRGEAVSLARAVEITLTQSREIVERVLEEGKPVYGLNTELGAGRNIVIDTARIEEFQRRTVRNSSGGVGEALPAEQVRAIIFARLAGFTRGGSGVRPELAIQYRDLLNAGVVPVVPRTGSVGASDLTQLAAIAAVATGAGWAFGTSVTAETVSDSDSDSDSGTDADTGATRTSTRIPGSEALAQAGLTPITLQAHEGLASISANSYSVGVGALVVHELRAVVLAADAAVALSLTALAGHSDGGNPSPFSEELQLAHPVTGQGQSAARIRSLYSYSETGIGSVQDPVSFRAAPQINGALSDALVTAVNAVELELNSRTDNPLVDIGSGRMISGGNFQAISLALSYETLRIALGHVAATSERRIARLSALSVDLRRAGSLRVPGLSWYSAAALVAEVRALANPVTLSGTSLSEEVEDHSSNAVLALQLLERSAAATRTVLAIEALTAAELISLGTTPDAGPALSPLVDRLVALLDAGTGTDDVVRAAERVLFQQP